MLVGGGVHFLLDILADCEPPVNFFWGRRRYRRFARFSYLVLILAGSARCAVLSNYPRFSEYACRGGVHFLLDILADCEPPVNFFLGRGRWV